MVHRSQTEREIKKRAGGSDIYRVKHVQAGTSWTDSEGGQWQCWEGVMPGQADQVRGARGLQAANGSRAGPQSSTAEWPVWLRKCLQILVPGLGQSRRVSPGIHEQTATTGLPCHYMPPFFWIHMHTCILHGKEDPHHLLDSQKGIWQPLSQLTPILPTHNARKPRGQ